MVRARDREEIGEHCGRCGITNDPRRSFCRACGCWLKPQPLARGGSSLKRSRAPKRESDKHRAQRPTREAVVAAVHARDKVCQGSALVALARIPHSGPLEVHELIPRGQWAAGYLVVSNCILICHDHHAFVTTHAHTAHALGLRLWSWERPVSHGGRDR